MSLIRRVLTLSALVLATVLAIAPASASAHAYPAGNEPFRDEVFKTGQPSEVIFKFTEPVEAAFGAVRVFDTQAGRVDEEKIFRPGGNTKRVGVKLKPGLPEGSYTATYRIVSSDGHVINGGIVFHLGQPSTNGALAVSDLVGSDEAGAAVEHVVRGGEGSGLRGARARAGRTWPSCCSAGCPACGPSPAGQRTGRRPVRRTRSVRVSCCSAP